jgi:hypothetical protein
MRVYHFLPAEHGLSNLRNSRIKIARLMELNDPFEYLSANLKDTRVRKAFRITKNELAETSGLLCFCRNWSNPVQWTHYADRHRGICLGFDIPDKSLIEVKYSQKRLEIPETIDGDFYPKCLRTKFEHWRYEEEMRCFVPLKNEEGGHYFRPFDEDICLKQVLTGAHSGVSRRDIRNALGGQAGGIEIFRVRASFEEFEMVRHR